MATKTNRTVVIAVDGTSYSKAAFEWYLANMWRTEDLVVVTHIPETPSLPSLSFKSPLSVPVEEWETLLREATDRVRRIEEDYEQTLVQKKIQYKMMGDGKERPGPGIIAVAEEIKADMIVIGTRGLTSLKRTFLGSVSDHVIHNTKIPVTIVPSSQQ